MPKDLIAEFFDNDGKRRGWRIPLHDLARDVAMLMRGLTRHHADISISRVEWYTVDAI